MCIEIADFSTYKWSRWMKVVVRKDVYFEIMKSLFNPGEHPRGAGGKFIHKLAPNTGLGGSNIQSNTQRRIDLANQAQNISQEEPNIKELNLTAKDDLKQLVLIILIM